MKQFVYSLIIEGKQHSYELTLKGRKGLKGLNKNEYQQAIEGYENCFITITEEYDPRYSTARYSATLINNSNRAVSVSKLHLGGTVASSTPPTLDYYGSGWGNEYHPKSAVADKPLWFGGTNGRSCGEHIPFAQLTADSGATCFTLGWSGCWDCVVTPTANGCTVLMGISSENFTTVVNSGDSFTNAPLYIAYADVAELACLDIRRYFKEYVTVFDEQSFPELPVEVNTWWVYEDRLVNEDVFQSNSMLAKEIGCTHTMMDAGWFGEETKDAPEEWFSKRGDWEVINTVRFKSGMKSLCDKAREGGINPGIWCEIEAIGKDAKLNTTHPHFVAKRDGESLGYLCFGSEAVREWAMGVMDRIIAEYGATWIKLDFNLNPAPGCNCENHGHGKDDGLYAHYKGYYKFLDDVRQKYPKVILENCASGGQRGDIEMLAHTHITFLSDPDFTDLHLQCYWGALSYLHPSVCFHFSWSDVTFGDHNCGVHHPITKDMPKTELDLIIRAALMGVLGFSYDFKAMPDWCRNRIAEHVQFYNSISKDFIRHGDVYRLTAQPLKDGGERFPAFAFSAKNGDSLVFAFRLKGASPTQTVKLMGLTSDRYEVSFTDSGVTKLMTADELTNIGLTFEGMAEKSSEIVRIKAVYEG